VGPCNMHSGNKQLYVGSVGRVWGFSKSSCNFDPSWVQLNWVGATTVRLQQQEQSQKITTIASKQASKQGRHRVCDPALTGAPSIGNPFMMTWVVDEP
jgi:hypothetical protein